MARSIGELLPRPFADLTLDDVREIVATVGEEGESLFFERKGRVSSEALAKACAAFANTMGGLLVVGIADEGNELAEVDPAGIHDTNLERGVALVSEAMNAQPAPQAPTGAAVPAIGGMVARAGMGLVAAAPVCLRRISADSAESEGGGRGDGRT